MMYSVLKEPASTLFFSIERERERVMRLLSQPFLFCVRGLKAFQKASKLTQEKGGGMKKFSVLFIFVFILNASTEGASASSFKDWTDEKAASEKYAEKVGGMMLRGLSESVTSPIEILYHTVDGTVNHFEYGFGFLEGLGTGMIWGINQGMRGLWDLIFAVVPDYNGEPGAHVDPWESDEA